MKTFVVEKQHPVEMSNYAPPNRLGGASAMTEEPTYDYIAPCGPEREFRPRRVMVPKINPHSVFVPIPARPHHGNDTGTWNHHRPPPPSNWNNQETLAMSQRL